MSESIVIPGWTRLVELLAADDPEMARLLAITMTGVAGVDAVVTPGLARASAINALTGAGKRVLLLPGTYGLEGPIDQWANGAALIGSKNQSKLVPSFTPGIGQADDPTNALIKIQGATSSATINTTLTTSSLADTRQISVASATGIAANAWVRIQGRNTPGYPNDAIGMSDGADVVLTELVKVDSTYVSGLNLPLSNPIDQHHMTGLPVIGAAPVENVTIEGVPLDCSGGTIAVGILADYVVGLTIRDCSFKGLSRAAIHARLGSRDVTVKDCRFLGENNSLFYAISCQKLRLRDLTCDENGKRFHANGYPRPGIFTRSRCTDVTVDSCDVRRMTCGISTWGGWNIRYRNIVIDDMDANERAARGDPELSGNMFGVGVDAGAGPLNIAEFGKCVVYQNVQVSNCIQSGELTQAIWYLHDLYDVRSTGCSIDNTGVLAGTAIGGVTHHVTGMLLKDCTGACEALAVLGCNYGFRAEGSYQQVHFEKLELNGQASNGNSSIAIYLFGNGGAFNSPRFENLIVRNYNAIIRFASGFVTTPDYQFSVPVYERDFERYTNCILALNNTGSSVTVGDLVKLDSASPSGTMRVIAPTADGDADAVVMVGGSLDVGTDGSLIMVSLLPAERARINVNGAVAVRDLIKANTSREGVVDNATTVACARALEVKGAGTGLVRCGPV